MTTSRFLELDAPPLRLFRGEAGAAQRLAELRSDEVGVFFLDAHRMRTDGALFEEFARELRFPDYFGHNWNALDECIADLDWLPETQSYCLVIARFEEALADEPEREDRVELLLTMLSRVAEEWATPVTGGHAWDRPARSFKAILQASSPIGIAQADDLPEIAAGEWIA